MKNLVIPVGAEEGCPVNVILSEEEVKQAKEDGLTEQDLIEIEQTSYRHWQADC